MVNIEIALEKGVHICINEALNYQRTPQHDSYIKNLYSHINTEYCFVNSQCKHYQIKILKINVFFNCI